MNDFYVQPVDWVGSVERGKQLGEMAQQRRSLADLRKFAMNTDFTNPTGRQQFMQSAIKTDPQIAAQYGQLFASMDENQRAQAKAMTEAVARTMLTIKQLPPDQQPSAYAQAQSQFPDALTEPYDPYVIDKHINDARSIEDMLKQADGFTLGEGQVRFDAQGRRIAGVSKPAESKWLDAMGPGGVSFKYNDQTRQTNLAKPGGGFYTLDDLGGAPTQDQGAAPTGDYRTRLRGYESAGGTMLDNPQSSATGPYQFMPDTWQDLGLDAQNINDPTVQEQALGLFLDQNAKQFAAAFGRGPNVFLTTRRLMPWSGRKRLLSTRTSGARQPGRCDSCSSSAWGPARRGRPVNRSKTVSTSRSSRPRSRPLRPTRSSRPTRCGASSRS
jgi:hypothetical protein